MRAWVSTIAGAGLLAASAATAAPAGAAEPALTLTLYGQGFALVEEGRRVELPAGEVSVRLEGVARRLLPETVAISGPGLQVLEQRAETAPLSRRRLLEAAVGGTVLVVRQHPETGETIVEEAELLSLAEGPVLRLAGRIETEPPGRLALPGLPEGLHAEPAVAARLAVETAGRRRLVLGYLAEGLSWRADYVARLDAAAGTLALTGLAGLANDSGADYREATVRLVAGEVNRARREAGPQPRGGPAMLAAEAAPAMPQEEAAGELHRYDLPRPVTLVDGEAVQVPLLAAGAVAFERRYRLAGLATADPHPDERGPVNPTVRLTVENTAAAGLGEPLPAGTVRVYGGDDEAGLFLGAAEIAHTPVGGRLELDIGAAFDVTAETRVTAYEQISQRAYELAREVVVANAKAEAVAVEVVGRFPREWRLIEESHPHAAETAQRPVWTLDVPAGGETRLAYRVRVSR